MNSRTTSQKENKSIILVLSYISLTQFMPKYRKLVEEDHLNRLPKSHSEISLPITDLRLEGKIGIRFLIYTSHS